MDEHNQDARLQKVIKKEGTYRAIPVAWTIEPSQNTQSTAVRIGFAIHQEWTGDETGWSQVWPQGYYAENRSWIIKKDGTPNVNAAENLQKCGLWNPGDFEAFKALPPNIFCLIDVQAEEYEGQTYYRANWVNPDSEKPQRRQGGFQAADPSLLASLNTKFSSQFRAISGGQTQGSPPAPPTQPAQVPNQPSTAPPVQPPQPPPPQTPLPTEVPQQGQQAPPALPPGSEPSDGLPPAQPKLYDTDVDISDIKTPF